MPTWGRLLREIDDVKSRGMPAPLDVVRRRYLRKVWNHTGRNAVLYATEWTSRPTDAQASSITDEDIQAFMEVFHGISGDDLDLIIHSPGGSAEATEALVHYIRSKFSHVRVIVPHGAMSAATMLACSADEIVMGRQSYLGPIDPQLFAGQRCWNSARTR